ncbi:MAG: aromatic amino acid transport family protein [Candidatus Omnitrophota bacterium]|jgi:tyrosine-specific transport protein|nr:aromatic amino acid transport family protein [Candidatus Omnitrophota bacterium]MDD4981969.1 aromatic amino acid transport family protein [Candidatus Omnitrophota bacterium]MDD5665005.1 aromatic amino acid transport family protein [Candidatus Omnitrophota bacterium]
MNKKMPVSFMIMVVFFMTGSLIGAGILGLPIKTGMAGLFPSLIGTLIVSLAMFVTALVLMKEAVKTRKETFHYPSMYQAYFGSIGKWIATIANLVILYGSLVVYLSGATAIIIRVITIQIPREIIILLFFLPLTAITITNPKKLFKFNALFVVLLIVSFAALVLMGEKFVDTRRFMHSDWGMFAPALPIIVMAAYFHNVIPTVSKQLDWNVKWIFTVIFITSVIGLIMNSLWIQVGIGALPLTGNNGIVHALNNNLPATVPLGQAIKAPLFIPFSLLFALLAIITSYLSFGNATLDFIDDMMANYFKVKNRVLVLVIAFLPPLAVTVFWPNIFLKALDFVGGIGVVILFGILPCIIVLINKGIFKRLLIIPVLLLFFFILLFKFQQNFNLSKISPGIEYWTNFRYHSHK